MERERERAYDTTASGDLDCLDWELIWPPCNQLHSQLKA